MRPDEQREFEQWAGSTCVVVWEPEKVRMEFIAHTGIPLPLRVDDVHAKGGSRRPLAAPLPWLVKASAAVAGGR